MLLAIVGAILGRSSKFTIPPVDASEITALVIRSIEDSQEVKARDDEIGKLTLTEVAEISFKEDKQLRVAMAKLNSNLGTEEIFYSVRWHDRAKGLVIVEFITGP